MRDGGQGSCSAIHLYFGYRVRSVRASLIDLLTHEQCTQQTTLAKTHIVNDIKLLQAILKSILINVERGANVRRDEDGVVNAELKGRLRLLQR